MAGYSKGLDAKSLEERLQWEQKEYWLHLEATTPMEKYPAKQHARRVQEKLGVEAGLIYLPGSPNKNNEDSDMPAPFRQRRYFYYLSGCNEPDCHLAYDIRNDKLTLFIPRINPARVIWYGRGSTPAEAMDKYDIDEVLYSDELPIFIKKWALFNRNTLFVLHEKQNPLLAMRSIEGPWADVDVETLQPAMNLARAVKDDHEIGLIRKANDISSKAHREILANIAKFKNEAQVEGLFLDVCISDQARQQAYGIIAASGVNAGTLHYDENNQDLNGRQLMCLDAGCEWELYASDITRTFPLKGTWPSQEAKDIYSIVQRMQETCIQRMAPGVRYLDLHILAHQIAIDGLLQLGILHNGTREEIYKAGTSRAFFPHGLGHHVGLEVHDPGQGNLMSLSKDPTYSLAPSLYPQNFHLPVYDADFCHSPVDPQSGHLEPGMVVTVEPGVYFSSYSLNMFYLPNPVHAKFINKEVVARYLPVGGVRIEDDILVTPKGYENLTTAPKGEAMLEIIRSQNAQWPFISNSADLGPMAPQKAEQEQPTVRAPGISQRMSDSLFRSTSAESKREEKPKEEQLDNDFEPFDGPSLVENFNRLALKPGNTTRVAATPKGTSEAQHNVLGKTVCGLELGDVAHIRYIWSQKDRVSITNPSPAAKLVCRICSTRVHSRVIFLEHLKGRTDTGIRQTRQEIIERNNALLEFDDSPPKTLWDMKRRFELHAEADKAAMTRTRQAKAKVTIPEPYNPRRYFDIEPAARAHSTLQPSPSLPSVLRDHTRQRAIRRHQSTIEPAAAAHENALENATRKVHALARQLGVTNEEPLLTLDATLESIERELANRGKKLTDTRDSHVRNLTQAQPPRALTFPLPTSSMSPTVALESVAQRENSSSVRAPGAATPCKSCAEAGIQCEGFREKHPYYRCTRYSHECTDAFRASRPAFPAVPEPVLSYLQQRLPATQPQERRMSGVDPAQLATAQAHIPALEQEYLCGIQPFDYQRFPPADITRISYEQRPKDIERIYPAFSEVQALYAHPPRREVTEKVSHEHKLNTLNSTANHPYDIKLSMDLNAAGKHSVSSLNDSRKTWVDNEEKIAEAMLRQRGQEEGARWHHQRY